MFIKKCVTGKFCILHKVLVIGQTRRRTDYEEIDHWTERAENKLMQSILRINEDKLLGNYIF